MSNTNLFRFAGWSAILSILFSFAMFAFIGGGRGGMFLVANIIAFFFTAVVFYSLFIFHRPQSATLSLLILVIGILGLVLELIGSGPETPLGIITSVIYGSTYLLIGYLGYGNAQMPRWLAICGYVVGGALLVMAGAFALGQTVLANNVFSMLMFAAWIVWSVGIWRFFTSSKTVVTATA